MALKWHCGCGSSAIPVVGSVHLTQTKSEVKGDQQEKKTKKEGWKGSLSWMFFVSDTVQSKSIPTHRIYMDLVVQWHSLCTGIKTLLEFKIKVKRENLVNLGKTSKVKF